MKQKTSPHVKVHIQRIAGLCLFLLAQILWCVPTAPVHAANGINRSFSYQGRLMDSTGANVASGVYAMKFSLYNSASGGTLLYSASGTTSVPVALNITVANGLFSVLIGDTSFQGSNALDVDFNSDSLYLGVTIAGDAEMTPRKVLSAVPYAFNAEKLQGQYASGTVASTGGTLFTINQTTADSASATRTALLVQSGGTSNTKDFLIRGSNGTTDVFSVNRSGRISATELAVSSSSTLQSLTFISATATGSLAILGTPGYATHTITAITSGTRMLLSGVNAITCEGVTLGLGSFGTGLLNSSYGSGGLMFCVNGSQRLFLSDSGAFNIDTGNVLPGANGTQSLGIYGYAWDNVIASGTVAGTTIISESLSTKAIAVNTSSTTVTSTYIYNSASTSLPILEVRSGCDNANSSTNSVIILAGNTTDHNKFRVGCNGTVAIDGSFNTGGADYAEFFYAGDTALEPGDAVILNEAYSSETPSVPQVLRGSAAMRAQTLGIVSSGSGFIGNATEERVNNPAYKLISLLGQVPSLVTAGPEAINVGDPLMIGQDGGLVKAQGPGMIVGRALDALSSGAERIMVFVQPQWWAGDILTVASTTRASAEQPFVDSPLFTFQGSAWDSFTGTAVDAQYRVFVDVESATTSQLTLIGSATSTPLLTVSEVGDVAIRGRFYPSDRGTPQQASYIYYDGSLGAGGDRMRTNASGWGTGSYDFAEMFPSTERLEPGDIVVVDGARRESVKRSSRANQGQLVGIVSTQPGFLTGDNSTGTYPIALAGRVPTRVTGAQGAIHIGDALATSDIPGVAMKATGATPTVGTALEAYSGTGVGSIIAYVNVSWTEDAAASSTEIVAPVTRSGFARIAAGSTSVEISFTSMRAYPMVFATPMGDAGNWWISQQTDTGFTLTMSDLQAHDVVFTWRANVTPSETIEWQSDGTFRAVDPTSGQLIITEPIVIEDEEDEEGGVATSTTE